MPYPQRCQRIVDRALEGQGIVAHSPIPPNSWAFNRFVRKYSQDVEAAKQLLAQAGWKDSDGDGVLDKGGVKMEFAIMSSDDPAHVRVIEEITRQWEAIGVKAHPQATGFAGVARDFLRKRQFDAIYIEWRDPSADPDLYALWHSSRISDEGQNYASWQNRDADELLEQARLVTLTGPGGTGKTRLGLQLAAELGETFADGVYFVNLAPLVDSHLVVSTVAQALDLKEVAGLSLLDQLKGALHWKQLLLLLDNFEQVVDAAVEVAALLAACPNLKVLVTSRMPLHVRGEQEFAVPPLATPDPRHLPDLVSLSQYEAVALFLQRAQAVKPDFRVNTANAPAIAEICARLDGLPLAIELAAARIKLLPPQALLARLGQSLALLTGGARDAPTRQQTLRNTIQWSYDLLDAQEQRLFRWLSVFVGGCTLEAIEGVCHDAGEKSNMLNIIASLADKSLVQQREQETGEPQLTMLETVREYALECLRENEEAEDCQRAHAMFYLALAEEAEPHLKGAQQVVWWKRLEREQENLRAALSWLIGQVQGELALRLSGALWWFWNIRGYWDEGWR